jgi:hypothetical protein
MWQMTVPACHLQSYLAQSCTAIRPRSCSAIWHQSTVDSLLMSPQTMTEVLHRGTRGPADDQRAIALDRSQSLLPDRKEGMARAHLAQGQQLIVRRLRRWAADSHRIGMGGSASISTPIRRKVGHSRPSSSSWEGSRGRTETR